MPTILSNLRCFSARLLISLNYSASKAEIASISNARNTTDFSEFYNRLKDVKDYYRKHLNERVEILDLEVAKVDEDVEIEGKYGAAK
ncbi:hypothetical protein HK100_012309 [Physocladia obscura]|uniref:Splicing factor SF3a60 binding domain-containing protein n=1 Tax=Physocladia obscura TaxID=109957 RepID=A0AAD5XCK0_9FUNG|nr:hypothetical protein HK100_012309 [Physocladia obscura]